MSRLSDPTDHLTVVPELRVVKITDTFEADLDRQLPADRSSAGVPSRLDFLLYELPDIMEAFATDFDSMPHIVGAPPNVRSLIGRGRPFGYPSGITESAHQAGSPVMRCCRL